MCTGLVFVVPVPWLACVSHFVFDTHSCKKLTHGLGSTTHFPTFFARAPPCFDQVFTGDYFGPTGVPLHIIATGQQTGVVGGAVIRTSACSVVGAGHTRIHCSTPSGVGAGYTWTLSVAGQPSAPSVQTTSFAPPSLTAVTVAGIGAVDVGELGAVPTAGGATVTLEGSNFGLDSSAVLVTWNGLVMSNVAMNVPHSSLSFASLPGQGTAGVNVTLSVGGQAASSVVQLPFAAPQITFLRLDKTLASEASLDCRDVGLDGRPAGGSVSRYAVVVIQGVNFGLGDTTVVTIRDVVCVLRAPVEDSQLVCQTDLCAGGVECLTDSSVESPCQVVFSILAIAPEYWSFCLLCMAPLRRPRSCSRGRCPVSC
jgi:hypothetical protein